MNDNRAFDLCSRGGEKVSASLCRTFCERCKAIYDASHHARNVNLDEHTKGLCDLEKQRTFRLGLLCSVGSNTADDTGLATVFEIGYASSTEVERWRSSVSIAALVPNGTSTSTTSTPVLTGRKRKRTVQ